MNSGRQLAGTISVSLLGLRTGQTCRLIAQWLARSKLREQRREA
jgi:hypothetical protein